MTGVDILAMEEVVVNTTFNWSAYWTTFGVVAGILTVVGIFFILAENDPACLVGLMIFGILAGAFVGLIPGIGMGVPTEYKTQYKVTISDEVSMNEFLERYEIVDQDGKIYTVRERDGIEDGE